MKAKREGHLAYKRFIELEDYNFIRRNLVGVSWNIFEDNGIETKTSWKEISYWFEKELIFKLK
jgi:hypothetical protein